FCRTFGLTVPVVLAPMAGGPSTPELAAAVSNAGGLGSLGAAYTTPVKIAEEIAAVRPWTDPPFAGNLFASQGMEALSGDVAAAEQFLAPYHQKLGLTAPRLPEKSHEDFNEQMQVIVRARVPVMSFTFGTLPGEWISELKKQGTYVIGTATT